MVTVPLFKLDEYVRNFITVILQFSPEVIEWFIEIIYPNIQTRISFSNLKCYTTTTKERFSVFLVTFEVRKILEQFSQSTTLPAWVAQRCLQGFQSLGHDI